MPNQLMSAPALSIAQWLNTGQAITLDALRGQVVVIYAFQMLCPACVSHGLPQAKRVHQSFLNKDVVVLGLHSVFEHHDAMAVPSLKAFLHEYRVAFPVGVDLPATNSPIPITMQTYALSGTPSLIIIDRQGDLRLNHFGHIDDLQLGTLLGALIAETAHKSTLTRMNGSDGATPQTPLQDNCNEQQCTINT